MRIAVFSWKTWPRCTGFIVHVLGWVWSVFEYSDSHCLFLLDGDIKNRFSLESGIHRVQRIPPTEVKGRRHTSTIAVAILPCYSECELNVKPTDFKIEAVIGTGPGGQHRNKTCSAIRITHLPTKITAYCNERSQYHSKKNAMAIVLARIAEKREKESHSSLNDQRRDQIRDMGRGTRVRTYNFFEGHVKDERVHKKFRVDDILSGKLDLLYRELEK